MIGLDLGSRRVGYAVFKGRTLVECGSWELVQSGDHPGQRWIRLVRMLTSLSKRVKIRRAAYEAVTFGKPKAWRASQRWGGAEAIVEMWAAAHGIRLVKVHVASVKQAALGQGRGSKAQMMAAAQRQWPGMVYDADTADACWAAVAAMEG